MFLHAGHQTCLFVLDALSSESHCHLPLVGHLLVLASITTQRTLDTLLLVHEYSSASLQLFPLPFLSICLGFYVFYHCNTALPEFPIVSRIKFVIMS